MKIAVSVGDLNGVGVEILVRSHKEISSFCEPYYFIHKKLLNKALKLLNLKLSNANLVAFSRAQKQEFKPLKKGKNFRLFSFTSELSFEVHCDFEINPGQVDKKSGAYSFLSFEAASHFVKHGYAGALVSLSIHKKAWEEAGVRFRGHTEALRSFYQKNAIMMLGCKELFIGLFTEHVPLSEVSEKINFEALAEFLCDFYLQTRFKKIGVLAFNPHAGDYGVIGGKEEKIITKALHFTNAYLNFLQSKEKRKKLFLRGVDSGERESLKLFFKDELLQKKLLESFTKKLFYLPYVLVADTAFTRHSLKRCNRFVALYHDLALAPLKALYFEKSVNVSLNLPIIRTSVDHGTAFDKAYKNAKINTKSYKEAVKFAIDLAKLRQKHKQNNFMP